MQHADSFNYMLLPAAVVDGPSLVGRELSNKIHAYRRFTKSSIIT